jgi:hypothetical protein
MLGFPRIRAAGAGNTPFIRRVTPHNYQPVGAVGGWLYATQVERIEGIGVSVNEGDDVAEYEFARVTVIYESLTYDVKEDNEIHQTDGAPDESRMERFVTRTTEPTAEFITLPQGAYKWKGTTLPVVGSHGRIISALNLTYTWHQVPRIPPSVKTSKLIGCVNSAEFDGYPAGTLLVTAVELTPYRMIGGLRVYDIKYRVSYKDPDHNQRGHNYFYRYHDNVVERLALTAGGADDGATVYAKTDYKYLFSLSDAVPNPIPCGL